MSFPAELAIASRNRGKILEIQRVCANWPVRWVTALEDDGGWPDVDETGETYLENALLKARAVAEALKVPCIADDSGLEVDSLGGAPGTRSARYAGEDASDADNIRKLVDAVADVPEEARTARFRCIAVAAWPDGPEVHAEATYEGKIILEGRGTGGFGYDPVFIPDDGGGLTAAELADGKDAFSHRGRAFRALRDQVEKS